MRLMPLVFAALMAIATTAYPQKPNADSRGAVLTVCDVLATPAKFDGRIIELRGREDGTDESDYLAGDGCPGVFQTLGVAWPSIVALQYPGGRGQVHQIDFEFDWRSEQLSQKRYAELARTVPKACLISTYTGLFETRSDWDAAKAMRPGGGWNLIGFGHLGEAPAQLILQKSNGVAVKPRCAVRAPKKGG